MKPYVLPSIKKRLIIIIIIMLTFSGQDASYLHIIHIKARKLVIA